MDLTMDRLEPRHTGGLDEEGTRFFVRGAPIGARVRARVGRKNTARRIEILEAAPDAIVPSCPVFGACGGCQLQEMPLATQREAKREMVSRLVGMESAPARGAEQAYAYRNKLELSWGQRRWVPEEVKDTAEKEGHFLGFHPPGWFSRIVNLEGCPLGTPAMNRVIAAVQALDLAPAWNTHSHTGTWRHLVLRDGGTPTDAQVLVTLVTSSDATEEQVAKVSGHLAALEGVVGVLWVVNDGAAEVATGELRAVLHGRAHLEVELGGVQLHLPHDAFFQVNTAGAQVLLETIAEALSVVEKQPSTTLVDLYCGGGAIGLALAEGHGRVVGVELNPSSIALAQANADRLGITHSTWVAGAVGHVLQELDLGEHRHLVVDPPRAGLHPKVARHLAQTEGEVLIYVACNPASLARDREILEAGRWKLDALWTVDLFPQTQHCEAVARFLPRSK